MHLFSLTLGNGLVIEEQPPGSRWAGLGQVILSLTSITCKVGVAMPPHSGGSACQMRRPVKASGMQWASVNLRVRGPPSIATSMGALCTRPSPSPGKGGELDPWSLPSSPPAALVLSCF